jgi:flagellar hook-associated protein 2
MGISPLTFTGVSKYSTDLQTILTRAVQIASQPITQLQNDQSKIVQQKQLATNLGGAVSTLTDSLKAIGELGNNKALVATSSDTTKVTINSTNASTAASYTISEITSVARSASASSAGYTTGDQAAVSATGTVRLTIAGVDHDITLSASENNLAGLRDKINNLNLGVTATVLTTGTGATPFNLSLTSSTSGVKSIQLHDDPTGANTDLIASSDNGANTEFKLNGVPISKSSNLINDVVPGVSFNIAGTTTAGQTVTVNLSSSRTSISSTLNAFVSAYNAVLAQVDAQVGPSAGLLTGDLLVREASSSLRALTGYQGSGSIKNLADIGIIFGTDGKASFDQPTLNGLSDSQVQGAFTFFGSSRSGFGGLQSRLNSLSDPVTGLFALQQARYNDSDKRISNDILTLTDRVTALQKSTAARLQTYDTLLASLASQQNTLNASIQSLNFALYGKQTTTY